jgi:molybdopterin molybdotransferase
VVPAGTRLASRHLAAIAAAGWAKVEVTTRPRIAVISTGTELAEPGAHLGYGQVPDANGVALATAARASGAVVVHRARVADEPERLARELDAALAAGAELVLTSGGVSMGAHEVVRDLLEPRGAHVDVLAMQPGGPQATASWGGVPVVCFPGNPVSSQLSFELFVAPTLRELAGSPPAVEQRAALATGLTSPAGKRQYLRGRRRGDGTVEAVSGPGSHLVAGLARAELLIVVPEDVTALDAGATVEVREL